MNMDDVDGVAPQDPAHVMGGAGMHWQFRRQMRRDAMHRQSAVVIAAGPYGSVPRRGGDDADVVARGELCVSEGSHLGLDATRARQVAVRDMGDAHPPILPHITPATREWRVSARNPHETVPILATGQRATTTAATTMGP